MDIVIRDLSKSYGNTCVFSGFSCIIPQFDRCAVLAPSGAGKTTLLRLILGLEKPDGGTITGVPPKKAAVFQEDRLLERCSAFRNLALTVPGAQGRAAEMLRTLGLDEQTQAKPADTLSGGQKRRVALARALLAEADLVALDEPFTGLDESARRTAAQVILRCLEGRTLLLITHRPEDLPLLNIRREIRW